MRAAVSTILLVLGIVSMNAHAQLGSIIDSMQPPIVTAHEDFGTSNHQEGDTVTFLVVRSQHGIENPLNVQVSVSQSGNMLMPGDVGNKTVHFGAWADLGYLDLNTIDDQIDERDASVSFSIRSGTGYRLGSPTRLSTNVLDNDVPTVSVQASSASVRAGQAAVFRISRSGVDMGATNVNIEVGDNNRVLQSSAFSKNSVAFRSGETSASVSLATRSDITSAGTAHVTVMPGSGYNLGGSEQAAVAVTPGSAGLPTVSFGQSNERIVEGQPVQFIVQRNAVKSSPLDVTIQLSTSLAGLIGQGFSTRQPVTIPAWQTEGWLNLPTQDNSTNDGEASISASIRSSSSFRTGSPSRHTVIVEDDEVTVMSIAVRGSANVTEGSYAEFRITRQGDRTHTLTIPVTVRETGDMLTATSKAVTSATFSRGRSYVDLRLRTDNDTVDEIASTVTVQIMRSSEVLYGVGSEYASVTVQDNDSGSVSVELSDQPYVPEGSSASFQLMRTGTLDTAITVYVLIEKQGQMFPHSTETLPVPMAAGQGYASFEADAPQDDIDYANGRIRARLIRRSDYTIDSAKSETDWVAVVDDDLATVTVTSTSRIYEGQTAVFTFTRTHATDTEIRINLSYHLEGEWPGNVRDEATVVIARYRRSTSFRVRIENDPYDLNNAVLEMTIERGGSDFTWTQGVYRVPVLDNDSVSRPPWVSVSAVTSSVVEGQDAKFRIRRTSSQFPMTIRYNVSETGNMINNVFKGQTFMPTGTSSKEVGVKSFVDTFTEDDSTVTVSLSNDLAYSYGYQKAALAFRVDPNRASADVVVRDKHDVTKSIVSIAREGPASIAEGDKAQFRITRTAPTGDRLLVRVQVGQEGRWLTRNTHVADADLPPNENSVVIEIETNDDIHGENDGWISAFLLQSRNYNVASTTAVRTTISSDDAYVQIVPHTSASVDEGSNLDLVLNLMQGGDVERKIQWWTEQLTGTDAATAGTDYTGVPGTGVTETFEEVLFAVGNTTKTVTVETETDDVDDADETFRVHFGNDPNATQMSFLIGQDFVHTSASVSVLVTITNEGALPKVYLSGMGREVSRHIVEALSDRMQAHERADRTEVAPRGDDQLPTFTHSEGNMAFWSAASSRSFEVAESEGEVDSYTVGADVKHGDWLFGVGITMSEGEGDYKDVTLKSSLTTAHPYAAWSHEGWLAWGTLGQGTGTLKMYDAKHKTHYRGIDIGHTMVAGGVDREHSTSERVRINLGAKGFWSVTRSEETQVDSGRVHGAKAPNLSLQSYVDATLNPDGAVQPTLGMALTYDRDDYETSLRLRPSIGVSVAHGALKGHVEAILADGRWDVAGGVMFQPDQGFYAGLTRTAPDREVLEGEPIRAQLQIETGWKRNGLSPYVTLGGSAWQIGQKLGNATREFDMHLRSAEGDAQLRVGIRLSW